MWLIDQRMGDELSAFIKSKPQATATQMAEYEARVASADSVSPDRIMSKGGDVATINVTGVLTSKPNFFAVLFGSGNTTYPEIHAALDSASTDGNIKSVDMIIDSGGGQVLGMFDLMDAMATFEKPINVIVSPMAASAAYGIASQGDTIKATSESSTVGSIGVVIDMSVDAERVSITNSDSPKKRPDVTTDAGREIVQAELDEMFDLFAEKIAAGRNVSEKTVRKDFGQGGMFLAKKAIDKGMIDGIVDKPVKKTNINQTSTSALGGGTQPKDKRMDLTELLANHPTVHAEAVAVGVKQEKERCQAHLILGEASGDMSLAIEAINGGALASDQLISAKYTAASMKNANVDAQNNDSDDAGDAADAAVSPKLEPKKTNEEAFKDSVDDIIAEKMGLDHE